MKRFLAFAAVPAVLFSMSVFGQEQPAEKPPLEIEAEIRRVPAGEDQVVGSMTLKVDEPIPKGGILTMRLEREITTIDRRSPKKVMVKEMLLPVEEAGKARWTIALQNAVEVPGIYHLTVTCDLSKQYPKVKADVAPFAGRQGTQKIEVAMDRQYWQEMLRREDWLVGALTTVADFLEGVEKLERQVAENREEGLKAWGEWRKDAVPEIEEVIQGCREMNGKYFPETYQNFGETFVFAHIFQNEGRTYSARQAGAPPHITGPLKSTPLVRKALEPYENIFTKESVYYRLQLSDWIFRHVDEQTTAVKRNELDPEKWQGTVRNANQVVGYVSLFPEKRTELYDGYRENLVSLRDALTAWLQLKETEINNPDQLDPEALATSRAEVQDLFQKVARSIWSQ